MEDTFIYLDESVNAVPAGFEIETDLTKRARKLAAVYLSDRYPPLKTERADAAKMLVDMANEIHRLRLQWVITHGADHPMKITTDA